MSRDTEGQVQVDGAQPFARSTGHLRRLTLVFAAFAALILTSTACEKDPDPGPKTYFQDLPPPAGDAPLRYRDPMFEVTRTNNITWGSAPNRSGAPVSLALDMYEPTGDTVAQRPLVIIAHSGGFFLPGRTRATSVDLATRFASKGYVAVSISYRLLANVDCGSLQGLISDASGCRYATMAATSDAQAAVRWARANASTYRIDPNRIAIMGDSAGALMSLLTGILADIPGTPEAAEIMGGAPENVGNPGYSSAVQAWSSISGGLPPTETVGLAQKMKEAPTPPPPGYLFASPTDNQTPFDWSVDVRDQLVTARRVVAFASVTGGHVPYGTHKELFNSQTSNLFYFALDLASAAQ